MGRGVPDTQAFWHRHSLILLFNEKDAIRFMKPTLDQECPHTYMFTLLSP